MKHIYDIDQPEMFPLLKELRQILDAHPGSYAVGETFLPSPQKAAMYAGEDKLHASFSFEFTGTMGFGMGAGLLLRASWNTLTGANRHLPPPAPGPPP
jgi:hypothetical protein